MSRILVISVAASNQSRCMACLRRHHPRTGPNAMRRYWHPTGGRLEGWVHPLRREIPQGKHSLCSGYKGGTLLGAGSKGCQSFGPGFVRAAVLTGRCNRPWKRGPRGRIRSPLARNIAKQCITAPLSCFLLKGLRLSVFSFPACRALFAYEQETRKPTVSPQGRRI